MDFFEYQADAKKRTKLLVFYYAMAVILIIASVYVIMAIALGYAETDPQTPFDSSLLWRPELLFWTALLVGGIIGLGSLFKIHSLSGGGKSVASMLGGRPISADTNNPAERRLLNIVEEMAIASGVPVPPVYVLDQEGINAFAAGFKPSDAVIGVTRGCLDKLNRDELQGVIAHEFSHIINGDMRLNIRLIGVLFGILLITVVGQVLMRIGLYSGLGGGGRRRSSRSSGKGNGLPIALMLMGLLLIIVGSIGVFFGRLIKSAVSRQREFLADASAVQFTRNPEGIAGALKKIGGFSSRIDSVHAEEASHMFFANSLKSSMSGLLATHPPLRERIRRLEPGSAPAPGRARTASVPAPAVASGAVAGLDNGAVSGLAAHEATSPEQVSSSIGAMQAENLSYAAKMIESIPQSLRAVVRTPQGARAVIYCLLLSREKDALVKQQDWLRQRLSEAACISLWKICRQVDSLPAAARMPMVDLTFTALQQQSQDEYRQFKETVQFLISADQKVGVFEFALSRSLLRNLEPVFGRPEKLATVYHGIQRLRPHCLPLLALLARYGNEDDPQQAAADFAAGVKQLGADSEITPMPDTAQDPVKTFDAALKVLRQASDKVKRQIVNACVAAVVGNHSVTVEESELLRAVVDSLDCPMPPLISVAGTS